MRRASRSLSEARCADGGRPPRDCARTTTMRQAGIRHEHTCSMPRTPNSEQEGSEPRRTAGTAAPYRTAPPDHTHTQAHTCKREVSERRPRRQRMRPRLRAQTSEGSLRLLATAHASAMLVWSRAAAHKSSQSASQVAVRVNQQRTSQEELMNKRLHSRSVAMRRCTRIWMPLTQPRLNAAMAARTPCHATPRSAG